MSDHRCPTAVRAILDEPQTVRPEDIWIGASDDHPGGPLSRAERIVLSNIRKTTFSSSIALAGLSHILGAIPGNQKIAAAHKDVLKALGHLLEAIKTRRQGAPFRDAK